MEKNTMKEDFNTQDKLCIVYVLDTSESMAGTPINELNDYVKVLFEDIKEDNVASQRLEIGIVTFDNTVKVVRNPENVRNNTIIPHLTLGGLNTTMVDGIREAIMLVNSTKAYYKSTNQGYYQPIIILVSNNFYASINDIDIITQEIKEAVNTEYLFYLISTENSNMNKLKRVSSNRSYAIKLQNIIRLKDLHYKLGEACVTKSTKDTKINLLMNGMNGWPEFSVE